MNELTNNQRIVLDAVSKAGGAVTAYDILDVVRASGIRAPVQVYRALEKLIEIGLVHRIESLNAFIACCRDHDHADDHGHATAFAICDDCGEVTEIPMPKSNQTLKSISPKSGFITDRAVIELRGHCAPCAAKET